MFFLSFFVYLCFFFGGSGLRCGLTTPLFGVFSACSVPSPSQGATRCAFNPGGGAPKKKKAEKGILAIFPQQRVGDAAGLGAVQIKAFFGFLTVFSGSSIKSRVPRGSSGAAFCPKFAFSPLFLPLYSSGRLGGMQIYANEA